MSRESPVLLAKNRGECRIEALTEGEASAIISDSSGMAGGAHA